MVGAFACIDFPALSFSVSVSLTLLKEETFPQPCIQFPAAAGCVHVSTFAHTWTRAHLDLSGVQVDSLSESETRNLLSLIQLQS